MLREVASRPPERELLITRLVEEFGLLRRATDACAQAGIPGREQQVAYCLVALAEKGDPLRASKDGSPSRTYELDVDEPGFPERLEHWAHRVARNLRRWAAVHDAIHDDIDRFEITTLRTLIRSNRGDDVIDRIADHLATVIAGAPRLHEMSLELAREIAPAANEYVFHRPLESWITTTVRRREPPETDALEDHIAELRPPMRDGSAADAVLLDEIEVASATAEEELRSFVERIAALIDTHDLMTTTLERVAASEATLAARRPASPEDADALTRIRAELLHEIDELQREQRAMTGMLAYIALAMPRAKQLQRVSVLSLRVAAIDHEAANHMAARMRTLLDDDAHPAPLLVMKVSEATLRGVPRSRLAALEQLRSAPTKRAVTLAPVDRMLRELPPGVVGIDDIAGVADIAPNVVKTHRSAGGTELAAVDKAFGWVFRRFAMGKTT